MARGFAWVFGLVFLGVGIYGFMVTGFDDAVSREGEAILAFGDFAGFSVNPLHNVVHSVVGLALLGGAVASAGAARAVVLLVSVVYLVVGVVGWFVLEDDVNVLALDRNDNLLHLGTAVLGLLAVALTGRTETVMADAG